MTNIELRALEITKEITVARVSAVNNSALSGASIGKMFNEIYRAVLATMQK